MTDVVDMKKLLMLFQWKVGLYYCLDSGLVQSEIDNAKFRLNHGLFLNDRHL